MTNYNMHDVVLQMTTMDTFLTSSSSESSSSTKSSPTSTSSSSSSTPVPTWAKP